MELDEKLATCTDDAEKRQIASSLVERETRVIGVYRQVNLEMGRGAVQVV